MKKKKKTHTRCSRKANNKMREKYKGQNRKVE